MNLPLVILCGAAGSGKDTAAAILRDRCGAVSVAQADPMKRFVMELFGFPVENLWGPSSAREALVPVTPIDLSAAVSRLGFLLEDLHYQGFERVITAVAAFRTWYVGQVEQAQRQGGMLVAREVLQTLGTEFGRAVLGLGAWNDHAIRTARKLLGGGWTYTAIGGLKEDPGTPPAPMSVITDGRFVNEIVGTIEAHGVPVLITGRRSETVGNAGHRSETELATIPPHFFGSVVANDGSIEDLEMALEDMVEMHFSPPTWSMRPSRQSATPWTQAP